MRNLLRAARVAIAAAVLAVTLSATAGTAWAAGPVHNAPPPPAPSPVKVPPGHALGISWD